MAFPPTLKQINPLPTYVSTRQPPPPGRASAGQWCPATKRLAARYQRKGDKVKLAQLMAYLHERGATDARPA